MQRDIEQDLRTWAQNPEPKPLILRGARQVGKSYVVEKFAAEQFNNFAKINFEKDLEFKELFQKMQIKTILETLSIQNNIDIERSKTLIFLDEIQECPAAIQALRYFYEEAKGLHVIAAGSLLEFVLNSPKFKFPVGRVHFMYLAPMSFYEFLIASNKTKQLDYIKNLNLKQKPNSVLHTELLELVRTYCLIGGMPAAIKQYLDNQNDLDGGLKEAFKEHQDLLQSYKKDFGKYAKEAQHEKLTKVFDYIPKALGSKFKYSHVYPEAKTQEIKPAFNLLREAGLIHKISRSNASLPLGSDASQRNFKALFLDIGLALAIYDFDYEDLMGNRFWNNISGGLTEQFVGQELLANKDKTKEAKLYYWERDSHQSSAEIDYLIKNKGKVYPLEVKAGKTGRLKSLLLFIQEHELEFGLRVSQKALELENKVLSIPVYAVPEIPRIIESVKPHNPTY